MKHHMEFENILYQKGDNIARMVINRAEKMKALNRAVRL